MESTTTEQIAGTDDVERVARVVRKSRFARIGRLSSYDPEIAPTENELDDVRAAIAAWNNRAVSISRASQGSRTETDTFVMLEQMRREGWSVAVHNDYRLVGKPHTFWLFTHDNGRWVKGEGQSDLIALSQARAATTALSPPATPQAPEDVRERALDDVEARWSDGKLCQRGALQAAYDAAVATPVTVTMEECMRIATIIHDGLFVGADIDGEAIGGILRLVLGDRIQIAGSEGSK